MSFIRTNEASSRQEKLKSACRLIIEAVGDDPSRPGLLNTPQRFADAILAFTEGYGATIEGVDELS